MVIPIRRPKLRNHIEYRTSDTTLDEVEDGPFYLYNRNKFDYQAYNYERKGDLYQQGKIEIPRVFIREKHPSTDRGYIKRVCAHEVRSIVPKDIVNCFEAKYQQHIDFFAIYLRAISSVIEIYVKDFDGYSPNDSIRIHFKKTKQHKGERRWFICPYCQRCSGQLYDLEINSEVIWGCRVCLGLSYIQVQS